MFHMEEMEMKRNAHMMEKKNKMISAFVRGFVWVLHISVKKREKNLKKKSYFFPGKQNVGSQ